MQRVFPEKKKKRYLENSQSQAWKNKSEDLKLCAATVSIPHPASQHRSNFLSVRRLSSSKVASWGAL
jgi:hypothetical protein